MNEKTSKYSEPWIRACVNFRAGTRLPSCGARGAREMIAALQAGIVERKIDCRIETVHCMGKCHLGPTMRILPNGAYVMGIKLADVPKCLELLEAGKLDELATAFPLPADDIDA